MFYKLKNSCTIVPQLRELAQKSTFVDGVYFTYSKSGDLEELVSLDPTLTAIRARFSTQPYLSIIHPHTWFFWHVDPSFRACAINLLLQGVGHSLFWGKQKQASSIGVVELKYEPDAMYVYNTQTKHAVLNLEEERIIFSLSIYGNQGDKYEDVVNWCKEQGL